MRRLDDQDDDHEPAQREKEWSTGNSARDYEQDHGYGKHGYPYKEARHDGGHESIVPFPPPPEQKMQRDLRDQHDKSGDDEGGPGVPTQHRSD